MECPICIEKITQSKKVKCTYCEYTVCSKCTQQYLTSSADEPNCMNCKRKWDRELLLTFLPKSFINGAYKRHREDMLFERETAMMPSSQAYVEQEIQRRKNLELLSKLQAERNNLRKQLLDINQACFHVQRNINPPLENDKRSFVQRCGDGNCRGYLSMAWKCNICSMYTCSECNLVKGPERDSPHTCKEEDKLTVQMIRKDSKKCPSCGEYIFKIDGCDQMWCVTCHTAFSWRTGSIINGTIHNPHFYEFQRTHGTLHRAIGDIPCGGMPSIRDLQIALQILNRTPLYETIHRIHRLTIHIEHVELIRFNEVITEGNNLDLRIKYMMNEISTHHFKQKIQQREKATQKKRDIALVLNMFITTISDYFREIVFQRQIAPYIQEIKALINYTNKNLWTVASRYECVVPIIDTEFKVRSVTSKMRIPEIV